MLRIALRNLRSAPAYSIASIATLAVAIAAASAIFGAAYAILLRPLPIDDPGALVVAWETDKARGASVAEVTYNQVRAWQTGTRHFTHIAAMSSTWWPLVLDGSPPERLVSVGVSSTFFETVGARPALGRGFRADDDQQQHGRVAILSHRMWLDRFGGNPGVVGRVLTLDRKPHTVVGVMPGGFDFPRGTDVWTPLVPVLLDSQAKWKVDVLENVRLLYLVGRLRPGVSTEMAQEDLDIVAARKPDFQVARRLTHVVPLLDYMFGPVRAGLWWLLGAGAILLMVACANVSGLTLTRASLRRREQALRLALGATPARIARAWILETLLLALAGGVAGLVAGRWVLALVVRLAPDDVPRIRDASMNWPVAGFTLVLVIFAALVCAIAAVVHTSRAPIGELLADAAHATAGRTSTRTRSAMVVAQIALAVILLVGAGLIVRSFDNLRRLDIGFDPSHVLTMQIEPEGAVPPAREWFSELIGRIEHLPGVETAGAIFLRPLAYGAIGTDTSVLLEGQPNHTFMAAVEAAARNPKLNKQAATPEYFHAMRIPLLRGRLFDSRDRVDTPRVVVVGDTLARRLWPGQDPIGKRLNTPQSLPDGGMTNAWHTVIGVVKDVHYRGVGDVRLDIYEPAAQSYATTEFIVVRTAGDPLDVVAAVQAEIRSLDAHAVVGGITTLDAVIGRALAPWRLSSWLLALLAGAAFVLALVGLVGLMGLEVTQRAREFAVRIALGANTGHLRNRVLGSALARGACGLAIGIGAAAVLTPLMRSLLFEIDALDPATYGVVMAAVGVTVVAASVVPAVRAATSDPIQLLKRE